MFLKRKTKKEKKYFTVVNQKGGVGKTTTVVNLVSALSLLGRKCLVVDSDPQGNIGQTIFGKKELNDPKAKTLFDLFDQEISGTISLSVIDIIRTYKKEDVQFDVIPSIITLAKAERMLNHVQFSPEKFLKKILLRLEKEIDQIPSQIEEMQREIEKLENNDSPSDQQKADNMEIIRQLCDKIHDLKDSYERLDYDCIIIDLPPSLGNLVVNALCCTDKNYLIVPVETDAYSFQGIDGLLETLTSIKMGSGIEPENVKFLITNYDERRIEDKLYKRKIESDLEGMVFETVIRQCTALKTGNSYGLTIFNQAPESNGAIDYMNLAKEILGEK